MIIFGGRRSCTLSIQTPERAVNGAKFSSLAKGIVKLPVGEKSSVGSDPGTVELKLQAAVEIDPQVRLSGFTRRVRRIWYVTMMVLH
jgi:hypothetical protein